LNPFVSKGDKKIYRVNIDKETVKLSAQHRKILSKLFHKKESLRILENRKNIF